MRIRRKMLTSLKYVRSDFPWKIFAFSEVLNISLKVKMKINCSNEFISGLNSVDN